MHYRALHERDDSIRLCYSKYLTEQNEIMPTMSHLDRLLLRFIALAQTFLGLVNLVWARC